MATLEQKLELKRLISEYGENQLFRGLLRGKHEEKYALEVKYEFRSTCILAKILDLIMEI